MSAIGDMSAASSATRPRAINSLNIVALPVLTILAILWQMRWGTITDTSWLITVCERVLAGERLYVDLFDTNPPFSVWLYMPPVALAKSLGIAPEILVHVWTYLAAIAGLAFAGLIVRRASFSETPALLAAAPVVYAMLVLFPGNTFSQREHIGMALFLPMLALMAWRMRTGAGDQPSLPISVLAGIFGSVLLLVKPYYALMVLLPALFTCWRKRSLFPLVAIEHWVIGLICIAYLAAVLVTYPTFLADVYPLLADTYLKIHFYKPILQLYGLPAALLGLALWLYWPAGRLSELTTTAALASAAGVITLLWQARGWPYHAYPALLCAALALLCLLCLSAERGTAVKPGVLRWVRLAALSIALAASLLPFRLASKPSDDIVAAISAEAAEPTVLSIAIDIATAHPLSRTIHGDYRSRHPSLWIVPSVQVLIAAAGDDVREIRRLEALRDRFIAETARDIEQIRPDIILDGGSRTTLGKAAIHADPAIARALGAYRMLYQDDAVTVLIRSGPQPEDGARLGPARTSQ